MMSELVFVVAMPHLGRLTCSCATWVRCSCSKPKSERALGKDGGGPASWACTRCSSWDRVTAAPTDSLPAHERDGEA